MPRVNLTATRVQEYECEAGKYQTILWDSGAPGLGVRATAKGAKAFIFQARIKGTTGDARVTIGDPATYRLPAARLEANRLKSLTDRGIDPREDRASAIATVKAEREAQTLTATRESVTLADVWPVYLADRKPKWSDGHYTNHVNLAAAGGEAKKRGKGETVSGPLAPLMPVLLSALNGDKIADWLATESAKRATNAAQSFRILRALARWSDDIPAYSGLIPAGAFTTRKVRDAVPKGETKEGDSLQREQLAPWFAAVRAIDNPVLSAYLQGLLITGARRNELAALRWTDVDFQWNKLTISDKVDGARTIPLTPYLSGLLSALPRDNEWVFSSPKAASGHIESPTKTHQSALTSAKLPHVSIHGLRRTFGTLAEWVDAPTGLVAQIMGHKPSAIAEKHYTRRSIDFLRDWHVKIESWILTEAKIEWNKSN
jgi:integrase